MKKINAFWEERNIGLKTCELIFNCSDTIEDYFNSFVEENYNYIVAKVPKYNLNLVHELETVGFHFMETQFNISVATKELIKINRNWDNILSKTSYKKLESEKELDFLKLKISEGLFKEDRISVDERFGEDVSRKRYVNWISDIYSENKAEIYLLKKYNSLAGFFVIKAIDYRIYEAVIAGIFKEYQDQGLPLALIYFYLKIASERNGENVITSFSSNNVKMFNSFTKIVSFKILEILYVLRRIL